MGVVGVDQAAKFWAHSNTHTVLDPVNNTDLALGVASGPPVLLVTLAAITLIAFGWHIVALVSREQLSTTYASLLIGGAAANLIDRAVTGSVRDFIPTPWFVFNVADIALVVGAIGYLVTVGLKASTEQTSKSLQT